MENKKSIGLPGGPNEFLKEITQHISVEGYKRYSEDVNNPYNIIESSNITMEDVDFPVKGTDNLGNEQIMMPGMNYQFPGDSVLEVPIAKSGGSTSWNWKGKSYSGTLIPSMETETNRYARTTNGKIKTLPKAQTGKEQSTLSAYEEPAWYEKAVDYLASPMTALGYLATGQDLPDALPINMEGRNVYDMVIDMINPVAMAKYAAQAKRDYDNEEYLSAGLNTLGALPVVPAILAKGKKLLPPKAVGAIDDAIKSAYKYNPLAYNNIDSKLPEILQFNRENNSWLRQVGKPAIDDIKQTGVVRELNEVINPKLFDEKLQALQNQQPGIGFSLDKRYNGPFFKKGETFFDYNKKSIPKYEGRTNTRGKSGSSDYLIETKSSITDDLFQPAYRQVMSLDPLKSAKNVGDIGIMKPISREADNFNFYKKDWWEGYKRTPLEKLQPGGSTSDSLALYNNSIEKDKFYRNNPDYITFEDNETLNVINGNNGYIDKILSRMTPDGIDLLNAQSPGTDERFKKINNNLYQFGDILGGTPDALYNTDAPPVLLHRNIKPNKWVGYSNTGVTNGSIQHDASEIPIYDPVSIYPKSLGPVPDEAYKYSSTPAHFLDNPDYQKAISRGMSLISSRKGKDDKGSYSYVSYGNPNFAAKSNFKIYDPVVESYTPNLSTDWAANLKAEGKDSSYASRKQMYNDMGLDAKYGEYKGSANQNIVALNNYKNPTSNPVQTQQVQEEVISEQPKKEYSRYINIQGKDYGFNTKEEFFEIAKRKNQPKGWAEANVPKNLEFQTGGEYKVKSGDTFDAIAYKNDLSRKELESFNPNINIHALKLGQNINLFGQPVQDIQSVEEKPEPTSWGDYINPYNWGVSDRDDDGDFKQAFRAAREAGEDEFIWYGERYTTELDKTVVPKEKEVVKKEVNNYSIKEYQDDLKGQENLSMKGWDPKKQLWFPTPAPEKNGGYDIGYGHKIKKGENFSKGLTNDQVNNLFKRDIDTKFKAAKSTFNNRNLSRSWDELDQQEQLLLTDYQYNGVLPDFKKFMKAVADKDKDLMLKEYVRYDDGVPLGKRNDWTKSYINSKINYKKGGEPNPLTIYSNYINGDYDGTDLENKAIKIYDKLNRIHYKDAKALGMSPANYILSHVMAKA
jgi:LysM repeat protein